MIHRFLGCLLPIKYFIDQQGIMNRYLHEKEHWESHLKFCRSTILNSLPQVQSLKIAILGSGWLLDIPMAKLLQKHQLTLYDINHPNQIKHKYRDYENVKFIEKDLTNGLVSKARRSNSISEFKKHLENVKITNEFKQYDYVISVNLLNQLDIILIDFLKMNFKAPDCEYIELRKKIQENHILSLPEKRSILISDWFEHLIDDSNKIHKSTPLIHTNIVDDKTFQEWIWVFDTRRKYRKEGNTHFSVRALSL